MAAATSLVFRVLGVDAGASATIRKVGLEAEAAGGKFDQLGGKLKKFSLGAAAAVIGVGAASVKMAMDFDQAMTRIGTMANVPKSQLKGLSDGVLNLAGQVGYSPTSLANALYMVESSFQSMHIKGFDALAALKVAAEGAKIGGSDLLTTTQAMDALLASGMVNIKNYAGAMDAMTATVGSGEMTMQDYVDSLNGMQAIGKEFGVNMADMSAALATFGDNNIRGAQAGTTFRMVVQALASPLKTGKTDLASIGLSMTSLAQDMQKGGLNKAIQDLNDHLNKAGITGGKVGAFLTQVFGKRGPVIGIGDILSELDRFNSKYKDYNAMIANGNSLNQKWADQQKQFKQQWDELIATVQVLGVKLGNWLIPKIQDVIKWFGKHKDATKALEVALGVGLVAALTAATAGAVAFTAALLTNPVFLFIAALEAAGVAGYELGSHWSEIWSGIKHVTIVGVKAVVDLFLGMASQVIHGAAWAFGWIPGLGGKLKSAAKSFDDFKNSVNASLENILSSKSITINATAQLTGATDGFGHPLNNFGGVGTGTYGPTVPGNINQNGGVGGQPYGPRLAGGGPVSGPGSGTSDSIPAMLSNGEFVVNAAATSRNLGLLHAINAQGFAAGGLAVVPQLNASMFSRQLGAYEASLPAQAAAVLRNAVSSLASSVASSYSGAIGGGVGQWAGLVSQVLGMLGLAPALLGKVLSQMTTESGGNPYAINLTDSNARAGHPAQGLMQVIPGTFAAYAGPYARLGILNPLANIYAGLNYAMHRYGPGLMGLGEGHGYAMGGFASGWARVGEAGPEMVYLGRGGQVISNRDSAGAMHVHIHAIDAQSVDQWLNRPGVPDKLATALSRARGRGGALAAF